MKILKKIKKILGLELPYLLEEEETEIEIKGNILKIPKDFYKSDISKQIEQLNKAISLGAITMEQARTLFAGMQTVGKIEIIENGGKK